MMNWLESIKIGLKGLKVHKVRATLSMLGIIFGVSSVVAVLSVVAGAQGEVMKQLKALGANNILVTARTLSREKLKELSDVPYGLTRKEGEIVASQCSLIDAWAPINKVKPKVSFEDTLINCEVVGTTPSFLRTSGFEIKDGRFLTITDDENCLRVCVIEEAIQKEFFSLQRAIGKIITIAYEPYTIVGVLKGKEETEKKFKVVDIARLNRRVYIPLSCSLRRTAQPAFVSEVDEISIKIISPNHLRKAAEVINRFFEVAHKAEGLPPEDRNYEVKIAIDLLKGTQKTQLIFNIVMGCSAGISLMVGGIGIMNIMLANVTERRREIGIRRSVGARQIDVLRQFIIEALGICLFGGAMGILLGIGLTWGISEFAQWKTLISVEGLVVSLGVSLFDGLIFGTYPAWKAARLDPIEALRYE